MGLAIAYNLALLGREARRRARARLPRRGRLGPQRRRRAPAVVDRDQHPAHAGVGRAVRRFARELGVNVWFRQGGYLFLARTAAARARIEKNVALQNRCDVAHAPHHAREARDARPRARRRRASSAPATTPTDGIVFPWPFLWGYARAAAKRGVAIHTDTPVTAIERVGGRLRAAHAAGHAARRARRVRGGRVVARGRAARGRRPARPGPSATRSSRPSRSSRS